MLKDFVALLSCLVVGDAPSNPYLQLPEGGWLSDGHCAVMARNCGSVWLAAAARGGPAFCIAFANRIACLLACMPCKELLTIPRQVAYIGGRCAASFGGCCPLTSFSSTETFLVAWQAAGVCSAVQRVIVVTSHRGTDCWVSARSLQCVLACGSARVKEFRNWLEFSSTLADGMNAWPGPWATRF